MTSAFWTADVARALGRVVKLAASRGEWEQAAVLSQLLAFGPGDTSSVAESTRDASDPGSSKAKTAAERMRAYRARSRNGVTASVTESVTTTVTDRYVTERNADPSPSQTLPLPETTSQVQDNSSLSLPLGSLEQGSDLEERVTKADEKPSRVTRKRNETDCPASDAAPDLVTQWCDAWRIPLPGSDLEAAKFLDHHRARGSRFRDWGAAWRTWQRNAASFARPRSAAAGARHVQPNDPNAPWMRDDHGRW